MSSQFGYMFAPGEVAVLNEGERYPEGVSADTLHSGLVIVLSRNGSVVKIDRTQAAYHLKAGQYVLEINQSVVNQLFTLNYVSGEGVGDGARVVTRLTGLQSALGSEFDCEVTIGFRFAELDTKLASYLFKLMQDKRRNAYSLTEGELLNRLAEDLRPNVQQFMAAYLHDKYESRLVGIADMEAFQGYGEKRLAGQFENRGLRLARDEVVYNIADDELREYYADSGGGQAKRRRKRRYAEADGRAERYSWRGLLFGLVPVGVGALILWMNGTVYDSEAAVWVGVIVLLVGLVITYLARSVIRESRQKWNYYCYGCAQFLGAYFGERKPRNVCERCGHNRATKSKV